MSTKQLTPIALFTAKSMSTSLTSATVELIWEDNPSLHWAWTGTPVGSFSVDISLNPAVLGWSSLPLTGLTQPSGSPGSNFVDFNQTGAAYIRLTYTRSGSTGTLNAYLAAKSV